MCSRFVNASLSRSKEEEPTWHVTSANFEHVNCKGVPRPTQRQVVASAVVRASAVADNSMSVPSLSDQLKLQDGYQCHRSMVGRAKEQVLEELFAEDTDSVQYLPSYMSELARVNSKMYTEVQRDSDGVFAKATIVLDSDLFINRQQIFGVDAAHMKHRNYNGVQLIFVARDSNMENKIAAVALVSIECADSYKWFFGILLDRGYKLATIPVFCDRHAGILAAVGALKVRVIFCTRHIIGLFTRMYSGCSNPAATLDNTVLWTWAGSMRVDKTIKLQVAQEGLVWGAQAATSKADYDRTLDMLESINTRAGQYLKGINPEQWALYPHRCITPLYGWRTTNFVESEQARALRLKPRKMLPFEFFLAYSKILVSERHKRINQTEVWIKCDRVVTPRAEAKLHL